MDTHALRLGALVVGAIVAASPVLTARADEPSSSGESPRSSASARCEALRTFAWPELVVEEARVVPAGLQAEQTPLPEHCMLRATLAPRTGASGQHLGIGFDLRMPLQWNGRFLFEGGGGLDGVLRASYGS